MANELIRAEAKAGGVKLWQIAQRLNINDGNFSRRLRVELPKAEQDKILAIINELKDVT